MDRKFFLNCLALINRDLVREEIHRAYNSIGSHIFFKFGRQIEEYLPNGRKTLTSEWTIWIANASWRITKHGKYIVGSDDDRELIHKTLECFVGNHFHAVNIISHYLDAEFEFDGGYKIITFFNWTVENQWLLFLPEEKEVVIDCSTEDSIKSLAILFEYTKNNYGYKSLSVSLPDVKVNEISCDENNVFKFIFSDNYCVDLGRATWRFEKGSEYYVGCVDYHFGSREGRGEEYRNKLSKLIEKKLKRISTDSSGMDAKLEFEDGYILEIFTHTMSDPWKLCHKEDVILCANIQI